MNSVVKQEILEWIKTFKLTKNENDDFVFSSDKNEVYKEMIISADFKDINIKVWIYGTRSHHNTKLVKSEYIKCLKYIKKEVEKVVGKTKDYC